MAGAFQSQVRFQEPIVEPVGTTTAKVPQLLLAGAVCEWGDASTVQGARERLPPLTQACSLRQAAQLQTKGAQNAKRLFALLEETVENG